MRTERGRKVVVALTSLANERNLILESTRSMHEGSLVPLLMCVSESKSVEEKKKDTEGYGGEKERYRRVWRRKRKI